MLNVRFITVGRLKERYLREACAEYIKRLSSYCKPTVVELNESRLSEKPSEKEIKNALQNEAKEILKYTTEKQAFNIALCIEGSQLSSEELAKKLSEISVNGKSTINFIIGSSFGLTDEIKNCADLKLSMSRMTFPHQLARVMLLEQCYRGFSILNNSKYHK